MFRVFAVATASIVSLAIADMAMAQSLSFGNKCKVKGTHTSLEFEAFLHSGGQWLQVDTIEMQIRIAGQGSKTFTKHNTNYINKNFVNVPWGCPRACISGFAVRNGIRYSSSGFCRGG